MANKVHGTHGCYVVPAFTGLGAHIGISMRADTIVGLTHGTESRIIYPGDA